MNTKKLKTIICSVLILALLCSCGKSPSSAETSSEATIPVSYEVPGFSDSLSIKRTWSNGYETSANVYRIPISEFKGEIVDDIPAIVAEQSKNREPGSSSLPNVVTKEFTNAKEAAAYMSYDRLQTPYFPYENANYEITVDGKSGSFFLINYTTAFYGVANGGISVENRTTLFTELYDQDVYDCRNMMQAGTKVTNSEFTTGAGLHCLVFEGTTENLSSMTAYISIGGLIYNCHTAYYAKDRDAAEQIIHDWAESLKLTS